MKKTARMIGAYALACAACAPAMRAQRIDPDKQLAPGSYYAMLASCDSFSDSTIICEYGSGSFTASYQGRVFSFSELGPSEGFGRGKPDVTLPVQQKIYFVVPELIKDSQNGYDFVRVVARGDNSVKEAEERHWTTVRRMKGL